MHHALYLEEILLDIFGHCSPPESLHRLSQRRRYTADLAVLARTCQTFKGPALNLLWTELVDLSPLARCLPEACCSFGKVLVFVMDEFHECLCLSSQSHSFSRPLNEAEWNTLRGYTHRVRFIRGFSSFLGSLDDNSVRVVFNPPFADPLFPNLRSLYWRDITRFPVVHVAVPSLTSLDLNLRFPPGGTSLCKNFLDSAGDLCPNIKRLRISFFGHHPFDETVSRNVCHWTNLQIVDCRDVTLNADALTHLSSMSTLRSLSFTLSAEIAERILPFGSVFVFFSHLAYLEVVSESLEPITDLLTRIRLPAVRGLVVKFLRRPSKQTVEACSIAVRNACPFDTLIHFKLLNLRAQIWNTINLNLHQQTRHQLTLDVILSCTAFGNLRGIHINLKWSVNLTDADLLDLVSASPRIEHLIINDIWGWRTDGGITLSGLLRLLQKCPSLYDFCLAIDTRTYTQIPGGLDVRFPARPRLWMNIVDSHIGPADVPALVFVFTELRLDPAIFTTWSGADIENFAGAGLARYLWETVYRQVGEAFFEQSLVSEAQ
jgi:hypothetical protein